MNKKIYNFVFILYVIELLVLLYIMTNFKVKSHALKDGTIYTFNEGWTISVDEARYENVTLPFKCNSKANSEIVMENTIPNGYRGLTLYFLSTDKTLRVYVDDEYIYEFGINDVRKFGNSPGALFNYIDLPSDLNQSHIKIIMTSPFENVGSICNDIKVAKRHTAILQLISNNLFELICSFLLFSFTFVLILICIINKISNMPTEGTIFMAFFCVTSSFYYLIQSRLLFIFYGNTLAYMHVNFIFLMLMPVWLAVYYRENLPAIYSKFLSFIIILGSVNLIFQQSMYVLNMFEYRDMLFLSHLIVGLGTVTVISCCIHMLIKKNNVKKALFILTTFLIFVSGNILDIIRTYMVISAGLGKFSRISGTIFCTAICIYHIGNYIRRTTENIESHAQLLENENVELTKAKNEAEAAKLEAIRANSAKNNFLTRISHEIRTPINAVLGMDNMILRESSEDSIKSYAMDIKNAGNTLLSLINDLLDFSKMESGNLEVLPTEYDISSVLHDIINMTEPRVKAKNLELKCVIDENIPSRLYGDDVRIKQIIINILTNAVKYTEKGTITFTVKYTPVNSEKMILHVDVTDTGIGIKEEDFENITVAFKRIEESRNRNIEGTGLGMNITVSLLSLMNSKLNIKSTYGVGSSFGFDLEQGIVSATPIGKFQERIAKQASQFSYSASLYAPDAKVLVVDDNPMNLKVFKGLLKHTGVNITDLESGYEALSAIQQEHYDIIFLDHLMPNMDGIETLEKMKTMEHLCMDTPVIILTANAIVGAKEMYLEKGFNDFLAKPIIPEKLESMLINYLPKEYLKEVPEDIISKATSECINVEDFPPVEGVDWKYAAQHFTDAEFLQEAVDSLYNTMQADIALLNKYYDDIDNDDSLNEYRIKVHALKSTTGIIGAMSVSGLARLLEYAAQDHAINKIKTLSPMFIEECQKLWNNLDAVRPKVEKITADNSLLITLLSQLKKKVEELDIDAMDEIVSEINKYELPDMENDMKKLLNDASNIDMEAVVADAEMMLQKLTI